MPETDKHFRRVLDVAVAAAALVLLAPLILLIALVILFESGAPVIFAQTRLGQGGRHFQMYKFRKFTTKLTHLGLPLTMQNDARMSRVGRLLANTKLDELPQFYNILRGDMSVVGPRPESLDFADCFNPSTRGLLDYRPGIFGPSQVAFRNERDFFPAGSQPTEVYREVLFPAKAGMDLAYYRDRTLLSDLKWMAFGLLAVAGVPSRAAARLVSERQGGQVGVSVPSTQSSRP
ncbi:MAG: sugar transferase [Mesorhizobium sp.]|uniref:sugar transferase n=1 Tax=Mesorhizobium sp. TaxID=1871066 RepID=UPI0011FB724C|nr:sugar transferase [Mesorhizobium sp.]TIM26416.1 MAG: sugar transferase [Mesorhizobium sp.]